MRRISYSDDGFVTTDAVAERLLEYAKLLGRTGSDDVVQVPAVGDDGEIVSVELLIGPASQLLAREVVAPEVDLGSDDLLAELDRRIAKAGPSRATAQQDADQTYDPDDWQGA